MSDGVKNRLGDDPPSPPRLKERASIGRVIRSIRHVRQERTSFRYELKIDKLVLRVPVTKKVTAEWIRGKTLSCI